MNSIVFSQKSKLLKYNIFGKFAKKEKCFKK